MNSFNDNLNGNGVGQQVDYNNQPDYNNVQPYPQGGYNNQYYNQSGYNNVQPVGNEYNSGVQSGVDYDKLLNDRGSNDGVFQSPIMVNPNNMYTKPRGNCFIWGVLAFIQLCLSYISGWTVITALLSLIFAISASSAKRKCNWAKMINRLRVSKILNIVGWIIILVTILMSKLS